MSEDAPLIELKSVSVNRDGRSILDIPSLSIARGEHVAILGPNGSGKSTLIKLLTREMYAHAGAGTVRILGSERWLQSDLRKLIGVVSDEPREPLLGDPSVRQLVVSGLLGTYGVIWSYDVTSEMWLKADEAMSTVEIDHLADRRVETLSAGEHRRAFIARALISDPVALVLDEPTTNLDIRARHDFLNLLRRLIAGDKSIILVTHHLEEILAEFERVITLKNGGITHDGSRQSIFTDRIISDLFEIDVCLGHISPGQIDRG